MIPFALHAQIEADSVYVRDLVLCQLRLQNQSLVPWFVLLPRREETEIYQLSPEDRAQLMEEVALVSRVMVKSFSPDKINVAALGNYVPQLHVHVVGRFKSDPAWPQPVWGKLPNSPYESGALENIKRRLSDKSLWD